MRREHLTWAGVLAATATCGVYACGSEENPDAATTTTAGTSSGGAGGGSASGGSGGAGGFALTGTGGAGPCVDPGGPDDDADGDGFTENEGDCADCEPNINPGAIEVQTDPDDATATPVDEDCDGETDEIIPTCDGGFALDDFDPMNGARAIELCDQATPGGNDYGVLSAAYVRANGDAVSPTAQVGIQDLFGDNVMPQRGTQMMLLSTGYARTPGQPDACDSYDCEVSNKGNAPPGHPSKVPGCGGGKSINDDIAFQVRLRAPTNATGYAFQFKFYSFEYSEYVCTEYNDQFISYVTPPPTGAVKGNISFDSNDNPVSVNIAYFDVCDQSTLGTYAENCFGGQCPSPPDPYCPSGAGDLVNTGFEPSWGEDAGATSWLRTTAPIQGGEEVEIRFTIWDTDDQVWDSSVLVDAFEWIATPGTEVVVETIPPPK